MAAQRTFAALVDQDSVVLLEYKQEKAGFRVVETWWENRRFSTPEAAADVVAGLLADTGAKRASLAVVLQHFGSFFHTLVIPPAPDEIIRPIILREVQRSFNITEPAIAYAIGPEVERRDAARAGGQAPRQVLVAGAPQPVVAALHRRFSSAKIQVEGLTVIPEVFRRLYDTLDGSTEATAVLLCLANGPHVAFFVNGQMEMAIDPPLALEGEAPLDSSVIIDQLERGAIFLRQQARGTVATRLLLSAPAAEYDALASTIEARTGMRVLPLGRGIGSPETIVAMGAVLAARQPDRLDLFPRAPTFDERLKGAMTGPSAVVTTLLTAAAVAVFWAGMQLWAFDRERRELVGLQQRVHGAMPALDQMLGSIAGRERIAGIRTTLEASREERMAVRRLLVDLSNSVSPGVQLDSFVVHRLEAGLKTMVFGRAVARTGPAAMTAASDVYRQFQRRPEDFRELSFESTYASVPAEAQAGEDLRFTISFIAPAGVR